MGANSSTIAGSVTHITNVTKVEKERIAFDWTILDIDTFNLHFQARSSTFQAGESLGRLSQWYLGINYVPDYCSDLCIGVYLQTAAQELNGPKDITARLALSLMDPEGKTIKEFGHATKTFVVPYFGGPQAYLDCYQWTHAITSSEQLSDDNSNSILSGTTPHGKSSLHLRLKMEIQGNTISSVAIRGPACMADNTSNPEEYGKTRVLWTTKEGVDCIIKCRNQSINAHIDILSTRSRVLATLFKSEVKTKQTDKENGNRIILLLDDIDPIVLESMLRYMYVGNLEGIQWNIDICSRLILAADKFEVPGLRNSCFIKFLLEMNVTNAGDIAVLAHNHCASNEIKCQISDFIRQNWSELENLENFYHLVKDQPLAFAFFHLPNMHNNEEPSDTQNS